jgi:hypothetical protein
MTRDTGVLQDSGIVARVSVQTVSDFRRSFHLRLHDSRLKKWRSKRFPQKHGRLNHISADIIQKMVSGKLISAKTAQWGRLVKPTTAPKTFRYPVLVQGQGGAQRPTSPPKSKGNISTGSLLGRGFQSNGITSFTSAISVWHQESSATVHSRATRHPICALGLSISLLAVTRAKVCCHAQICGTMHDLARVCSALRCVVAYRANEKLPILQETPHSSDRL